MCYINLFIFDPILLQVNETRTSFDSFGWIYFFIYIFFSALVQRRFRTATRELSSLIIKGVCCFCWWANRFGEKLLFDGLSRWRRWRVAKCKSVSFFRVSIEAFWQGHKISQITYSSIPGNSLMNVDGGKGKWRKEEIRSSRRRRRRANVWTSFPFFNLQETKGLVLARTLPKGQSNNSKSSQVYLISSTWRACGGKSLAAELFMHETLSPTRQSQYFKQTIIFIFLERGCSSIPWSKWRYIWKRNHSFGLNSTLLFFNNWKQSRGNFPLRQRSVYRSAWTSTSWCWHLLLLFGALT